MTVANLGNPGIRQPHRVDHPAVELGDARRRRAESRLQTHRLRDDATETIEVDHLVQLFAIGGGAGGEQNRVLEPNVAKLHGEQATWRSPVRLAHWIAAFVRRW